MSRPSRVVFPRTQARLEALGVRLRTARLRRRISQMEMAVRVGVSRPTIDRLERGDPNVAVGVLARVLAVLGLEHDLDLPAGKDEIGQRLLDLALPAAPRGRRKR